MGAVKLADYAEFVERISTRTRADENQEPSTILFVPDIQQAHSIILSIFKQSAREIEILDYEISPTLYNDPTIITAAAQFLENNPGSKLKIITFNENSEFIKGVSAEFRSSERRNDIIITIANPEMMQNYKIAFIVGDGKHYYFYDEQRKDESIAQFWAPELGEKIHTAFMNLIQATQRTR